MRCLSGGFAIVKLHLGHNHNNKQILPSLPKPNCSEKKLLNVYDAKLRLQQKWLMLLAKHKPLKSFRVWKITVTTQPVCTVCLYQNTTTTTTTRRFQVRLPNCGVEACSSSKLLKHPFLFDMNQTTLKKKPNKIPLNIVHNTIIKDFSCLNIKAKYSDHPSGDEVSHPGSHGCDLHEALVPDAHVVSHHVRPASRGDPQRKTLKKK